MDLQILVFCLYGGIVSVDTEAGWQVMISQPLVAGPVAGFFLGNIEIGIVVGILLELPFLGEIPAGAAKVSQGNLGGYVAAGIATALGLAHPELTGAAIVLSIILGLLLSRLALPFVRGVRRINHFLVLKAEEAIHDNCERISIYQFLGVGFSFIFGIFFSAFFFIIGKYIVINLVQNVPVLIQINFELIKPVLLGAGVAVMLRMHVQKKSAGYSILGAVSAVIIFLI